MNIVPYLKRFKSHPITDQQHSAKELEGEDGPVHRAYQKLSVGMLFAREA